MRHEYTVIPAPNRGEKAKGAKTPADRYALSLTAELNRMASEGWEYVRAETLPSEERSGLTGRSTVYHNMLVFRRALATPEAAPQPARIAPPRASEPVQPEPAKAPAPATEPAEKAPESDTDRPA